MLSPCQPPILFSNLVLKRKKAFNDSNILKIFTFPLQRHEYFNINIRNITYNYPYHAFLYSIHMENSKSQQAISSVKSWEYKQIL